MSDALGDVGGLEITVAGSMAPAVVHVDVVKAAFNKLAPITRFLADRSLKYDWDFGDADSRYNWLPGWHAAHLYDRPGTYTIKLIVSDATGARSFSQSITLKPDTRMAVHVQDTAGLISAMGASNVHLFLKRGVRYSLDRPLPFGVLNTVIEAEGTGDAPDLHIVGKIGLLKYVNTETRNTLLRGLRFSSEGKSYDNIEYGDGWMGWVHGVNNAVVGCEFDKTLEGIQCAYDSFFPFFQDNRQLDKFGVVDHFMWIEGHFTVEIANHGLGSLWENVRRTAADGIDRGLMYCDSMERPDLPARYPHKACYTIRTARDLYIYGCQAKDAWFGFEPRSDQRSVTNVVVEYCRFDNAQLSIRPGVHDVEIRHNQSTPIRPSGSAVVVTFSHDTPVVSSGICVHDNAAALNRQRNYQDFFGIVGDPTRDLYCAWDNKVEAPDGSHTMQKLNR